MFADKSEKMEYQTLVLKSTVQLSDEQYNSLYEGFLEQIRANNLVLLPPYIECQGTYLSEQILVMQNKDGEQKMMAPEYLLKKLKMLNPFGRK